jgi:hypothetical protein
MLMMLDGLLLGTQHFDRACGHVQEASQNLDKGTCMCEEGVRREHGIGMHGQFVIKGGA